MKQTEIVLEEKSADVVARASVPLGGGRHAKITVNE
jgi:hypothetical protein